MSEPGPQNQAAYDPAQREAAARLISEHRGWLVMWGPWSRRYFAYPAFDVPPGTLLSATSIGGLIARMRQVELTAATGPRVPQSSIPYRTQYSDAKGESYHA